MKNDRKRREFLVIAGTALAATACGGGGGGATEELPGVGPQTPAPPAPTPQTPTPSTPVPVKPARPALRSDAIPRLRGLGVQPQAELVNTDSPVFQRYAYVDDSGANALRLFVQPWRFETGELLAGATLTDKIRQDLAQWSRLIPWALERGIYVVLTMDLSIGWPVQAAWPGAGRSFWRDAQAQADFIAAWVAIAEEFKGRTGIVFDLLNEPHGVLDEDVQGNHAVPKTVWNSLYPRAVDAIRKVDPGRWLMVETIWGDADNFDDLAYLNEPRLLYSFHFYSPHEFTYQETGEWAASRGIVYPGVARDSTWHPALLWNREQLRKQMDGAQRFAARHGARIVVGEAGSGRESLGESRARWAQDVLSLFEEMGFDWLFFRFEGWGVPADFRHGWAVENSPDVEPLLLPHFAKNKV